MNGIDIETKRKLRELGAAPLLEALEGQDDTLTLGMGFGVTSATVLLALGVAPATASAATHAAKLPTTLISGLSHWRVGNIDKAILIRVAVPGAIGGFLGAVVLTSISLAAAKSGMAALLLFFGAVILAPIAARLAGRLPHAPMGVMVGGLIILVNSVVVLAAFADLPLVLDLALMVGWLLLVGRIARAAWRRERAERLAASAVVEPALV